ncbi:PAS/PAC sensor signal transduction histidine kinase [Calothrix sp. NIES-4101]|nr:PAS/PAC sensor signal transduction histidine kinase [Calothrix sp. NIES-4101]
MKRLSEKFVASGFSLALVLLSGMSLASFWSLKQLQEDKQSVLHTYEVLLNLEHLDHALSLVENGRRGLIVTNKDSYLQLIQKERLEIRQSFQRLSKLTRDNLSQQHRLSEIENLVDREFTLIDESLRLIKQNTPNRVYQIRITDEVQQIRDLKNTEKMSLIKRTATTENSVYQVILFVSLGTILAILILGLIYKLLQNEIFINKKLSYETLALEKKAAHAKIISFLESTTDAFVALDQNWNYTYVNQKAGELFNHLPESLIGKNIWEVFPEGIRYKFYQAYHQAMIKQELVHIQEYYPPWQRWYENRIYPSPDGLSIFFQDITAHKLAEIALQKQEERWQLAINGSNDGIWDHDLQTNQYFISPRCLEILGYAEHEIYDFDEWVHLVYPEDRFKLMSAFDAHVNRQTSHYSCEYRMRCRDGTYKWLLVRGKALWDEQEIPIRAVGSLTDITNKKQVEAELIQAKETLEIKVAERTKELQRLNEELEHSNRELEHFADIASHDLQEPLRAITAYTQFLHEEYSSYLDATASEYMNYIVDGAERMRQLIKALLDYSRVGNRELHPTCVDCNTIITQVSDNLRIAITENHATISYDLLPTITADQTQLLQLFQNLISNAIKFRGSENPQIFIRAVELEADISSLNNINNNNQQIIPQSYRSKSHQINQGSKYWLFSIQDNGIGIKSQYFNRIFEIFRRLHTTREFPGTGIGLAICKKIVERHGGNIWAESELGKGSNFYFTLIASKNMPIID